MGDEAKEANFMWREGLKTRAIIKEEGLRQAVRQRSIANSANSRLTLKSFRINKGSAKLKKRMASLMDLIPA